MERSSRSSSFSPSSVDFWSERRLDVDEGDDSEASEGSKGGGKTKPWRPLSRPPFPGKGRPTVGVGPQSTGGRIRAGRKVSNESKWGANKMGWDVHRGVNVERNVDR